MTVKEIGPAPVTGWALSLKANPGFYDVVRIRPCRAEKDELPIPNVQLVTGIDFRFGRNGDQHILNGCSHAEIHGTWALAPGCSISIPIPPLVSSYIVVVKLRPFAGPTETRSGRRIVIEIEGDTVFDEVLVEEMPIGIVRNTSSTGSVRLDMRFPDAAHPQSVGLSHERRHLAVVLLSVHVFSCQEEVVGIASSPQGTRLTPNEILLPGVLERATGLTAGNLMTQFESLGHSCDFGLVQREFGVEPLGLLRFTGISSSKAYDGLISAFEGLGEPSNIHPYVPDGSGEYWIHERCYDLYYHTFIPPEQARPEQLIAREARRLPFLQRKLIEDLQDGRKIFLLRRPVQEMLYAEVIAIWAVLNTYGDNTLLYLETENTSKSRCSPGDVFARGTRLYGGILSGIPGDVAPNLDVWLTLCANAYIAVHGPAVNRE